MLVFALLCSVLTCFASAETIPVGGSIWTPSQVPPSVPSPTPPSEPSPEQPFVPSAPISYGIILTLAENGTVIADYTTAVPGTAVTLTLIPNAGYKTEKVEALDFRGANVKLTQIDETRYTFTMPDSNVTITAGFAASVAICPRDNTCPMNLFADLDKTAWYHDGIHYCIENGLMNGIGNYQFDPDGITTRAMLVTVLWRLEDSPIVTSSVKFSDVVAGQWYSDAIAWASANGIVNGYGNDRFGPYDLLTREQVMAIFHRYVSYKGIETNAVSFVEPQYTCSSWAQNDVNWADANGILQGLGIYVSDMTAAASRAELATYLYRVIGNIVK